MLVLMRGVEPLFFMLNLLKVLIFISFSEAANLRLLISQVLLIILIVGFPSIINQQLFVCIYIRDVYIYKIFYSMKNINKITLIFVYILTKIESEVIFYENFQEYDTGTNFLVYLPFNGSWYRSDVLKQSGLFKIKGPNARISSKYLAVFADGNSSVNCIDISLRISSFYSLSFDFTWQTFNNSLLIASWNSVTVFSTAFFGSQGLFLHKNIELPQTNTISNTLCFSGSNPLSGIKVGPSVDNIQIQFLYENNSSYFSNANISFNSSGIVANNTQQIQNITNITTNTTANNITWNSRQNESLVLPDTQVINTKNSYNFLSIEWVYEFVKGFNKFLVITSFFGFSYLISNLLNFWNIIILYYFISNNSLLNVYKKQLLILCKNSLEEGSIFSLLGKIANGFNMFVPFWGFEKVYESSTEWPSFLQLGFSSQILRNNAQVYINLLLLVLKLLLIKVGVKILLKLPCSFWKTLMPKKVLYLQIYSYEMVSSLPTLIIPLAIMVSSQSSLSSISLKEKVNNSVHVLSILIGITGLLMPSLMRKKERVKKPERVQVKSTIFIESKKSSDLMGQIIKGEKKTRKMIEEENYIQRLNEFKVRNKNHKIKSLKEKEEILNQALFFIVPFLVGLQYLSLFFLIVFLHILLFLLFLLFNSKFIKLHSQLQFWFTFVIRLIFLCIHLFFLLLHLHQLKFIQLSNSHLQIFSFLAIAGTISGALLQLLLTIINFVVWIFFQIKKIKSVYCANKIVDSRSIKKKICIQDCSVKGRINERNGRQQKNPSCNECLTRNLELVEKTLKILEGGDQIQRVSKIIFEAEQKQR